MEAFRYKDRGPTSSADHNERLRSLTAEFNTLYSRVQVVEDDIVNLDELVSLDAASVIGFVEELRLRIEAAANTTGNSTFIPVSGLDVVQVDGVPVEADELTSITDPLFVDTKAGVATLPQGSYISKIRSIMNIDGEDVTVINPEADTSHTYSGAEIMSTDLTDAIDGKMSTAFTVEETSVATLGYLEYFLRIPTRGVSTDLTNVLDITLAPMFYCRLLGLQYTTMANPTLSDSDDWNDFIIGANTADEMYLPPRINEADYEQSTYTQKDFGSRRYYVNEEKITAIRVIVSPRVAVQVPVPLSIEADDRLLLGIRDIDAGHISFSQQGGLVWEVDLPAPVSKITAIEPRVVNNVLVGTYTPTVECYTENGGSWQKIEYGELGDTLSGVEKIRIKMTMDIVNSTVSPIVSGFDLEYEPSAFE